MTGDLNYREIIDVDSPLISAGQVKQLLGASNVKVFDVRGTWSTPARALPDDYMSGHIPDAVFLDWTEHFIAQGIAPDLADIANAEDARRSFQALGINKDDLVILYDASSHMQAGRIWLAMRHWGFENVRVLNGGWPYWLAQGLPISTAPTSPSTGSFEPILRGGIKIDIDSFLDQQQNACVIDARGVVSFSGKADDPKTGHIPGAINVPFSAMLDPDSKVFLDPDNIKTTFDILAPEWDKKPLIASCGSGYAATVVLLALEQIGKTGVLFDGSFAVWKQDPDRPIAQFALDLAVNH